MPRWAILYCYSLFVVLWSSHFKKEVIFSMNLSKKSASAPPKPMSVSLSHGNGFIGSVASSKASIGSFGFERSSGSKDWPYFLESAQWSWTKQRECLDI